MVPLGGLPQLGELVGVRVALGVEGLEGIEGVGGEGALVVMVLCVSKQYLFVDDLHCMHV